jgi:hypothetical protein
MANKKYTDFPAGAYNTNKIFLQADPITGALEKVNLPSVGSATAGNLTAMLAIVGPTAGQQFYMTDFLRGLWIFSPVSNKWKYHPSLEDIIFNLKATGNQPVNTVASWSPIVSGTGASVGAAGVSSYFRTGTALRFSTGTTATGRGAIYSGSNDWVRVFGTIGALQHACIVETLSTAAEEFWVSLGSYTLVGQGGILFVYHRLTSANWLAVATSNFAFGGNVNSTIVDTGIAVDTLPHEYVVTFDAVAGNAKYYIDRILKATITTTLPGPGSPSNKLFGGWTIQKTAGLLSRTFSLWNTNGYIYSG